MILSIRGTSGAGKTTVAKRLLHDATHYGPPVPVFRGKRKQPLFYRRGHVSFGRPLIILGHYESATGGCDTISGNDIPFDLIRELHDEADVFFEGLLMSAERWRTLKLHTDGYDVRLFYLNLTLQECLAGVNARRAARGQTEPVNPRTTASRHSALRGHPGFFRGHGVSVTVGDRDAALRWLVEAAVLGQTNDHETGQTNDYETGQKVEAVT
jgi:hypothetical protein